MATPQNEPGADNRLDEVLDRDAANADVTMGESARQYRVEAQSVLDALTQAQDQQKYRELHWTGSFADYVEKVRENPKVAASSFQRIYNMIQDAGTETVQQHGRDVTHYKFFDDPENNGKDAIFGIDSQISEFVDLLQAGADKLGTEKRLLLLQGPVGSAKSTLVRLLKKGLEDYTQTENGAVFTFGWKEDPSKPINDENVVWSPMNEDPLTAVPEDLRKIFMQKLNEGLPEDAPKIEINGGLSPFSRFMRDELMERYEGDFSKVMDHIVVKRLVISEENRVGIGTFQPKDAKSQDSTELTGDINYRAIAQYGKDSDPRAFNFDGELCVANRGLMEFIEVLKLDTELLYELLTATQEKMVKPKKFQQVEIDEVLIGHTNEPEYEKLRQDRFMEALRDRTKIVKIPYILKLDDEMKVYEKDYNPDKVRQHIAPHTIEVAAMFAILSRLQEPDKHDLSLVQKMHLYNGRGVSGYTEKSIGELREAAPREGHDGISPRFIQDTLINCLVKSDDRAGINPFMVIKALEDALPNNPHLNSEEAVNKHKHILQMVRGEYEEIVKHEVQEAIAADPQALDKLFRNYITNVKAYLGREKVDNPFTGRYEEPDERLMRSIEEKLGNPEQLKDDHRREIMATVGSFALENPTRDYDYRADADLYRALRQKLFEDSRDQINLKQYSSSVKDPETQEKIDIVKQRLITQYGYNEQSASDVLAFVASIYARGETK